MSRTYTCKVYVCDNVVERWGRLCGVHQKQRDYIPDGGMNEVIKNWQEKTPEREQSMASPSTIMECPRVVWFKKHKIPKPNDMGWGKKQRNMLGRVAENVFAMQLKDEGKLLWHWKDDVVGESIKFGMGSGLTRLEGTPDLLIQFAQVVLSDSKTSRADAFTYVPLDDRAWDDFLWLKNKRQVESYFLLCHKNKEWFEANKLPLPEACHLFSYALDDGVVKREFTWLPHKTDADEVLKYTVRWNTAYQSEEMPECTCNESQTKFCSYATETEKTATGYKLGTKCCNPSLYKEEQNAVV